MMTQETKLKELGDVVRRQGRPEATGGTMVDLVFNPVTGEFEQMSQGAAVPSSGMIVTEMTREGFACNG